MSSVWTIFHHAHRACGDVAVASSRSDDPKEWEHAHYAALRNMHAYQAEVQRWADIAAEMEQGLADALRRQRAPK